MNKFIKYSSIILLSILLTIISIYLISFTIMWFYFYDKKKSLKDNIYHMNMGLIMVYSMLLVGLGEQFKPKKQPEGYLLT